MVRPDRNCLARRLDHQAGRKNRIAWKVQRKDPVLLQIHLATDRIAAHFQHAIKLQHLSGWQVNGGQVAAGVDKRIQAVRVQKKLAPVTPKCAGG